MNKTITPERLSHSDNSKPERGGVSVSYGAPKAKKEELTGFQWKTFLRTFLIYFIGIYAVFAIYNAFIKGDDTAKKELVQSGEVVSLKPMDSTLVRGNLPSWTVESNDKTADITLKPICDNGVNTAQIDYWNNNKKVWMPILPSDFCTNNATNTNYTTPITLTNERTKAIISFPEITNTAFSQDGEYRLTLQKSDNTALESSLMDVSKPGIVRTIFRYIVSMPLYNILLAILTYIPGHNLLLAIVLLTVLIRIILYPINTKALQNQIKLKELQPELQRIQTDYSDNKQLQAMKTMMLYKDSGISPLASIYPILIQFPILIGLYYIISDGLSPHLDYLRYSFLPSLDVSLIDKYIGTLDLTQYSPWFLAIIVAVVQYIAFKFMMPAQPKIDENDTSVQASMQSAMSTMQYVFPVMIGVMTLSVPAIVGIYWAFSTLLGGLQQYFMTRLHTPKK